MNIKYFKSYFFVELLVDEITKLLELKYLPMWLKLQTSHKMANFKVTRWNATNNELPNCKRAN